VKSLLGLLLLAMFLPTGLSTISSTETSESFRVVAIPMRDTGYSNFESVLTLDETIPAYRVAQAEARKRLQETEKP
jgi:hypothetical protein